MGKREGKVERETEKKRGRRKGMREGETEGIMGGGGLVSGKTHYFGIQFLGICQTRKTFDFEKTNKNLTLTLLTTPTAHTLAEKEVWSGHAMEHWKAMKGITLYSDLKATRKSPDLFSLLPKSR